MNSISIEYISTHESENSENGLGLQFNVYKTTSQIDGDEYMDISDFILLGKCFPPTPE